VTVGRIVHMVNDVLATVGECRATWICGASDNSRAVHIKCHTKANVGCMLSSVMRCSNHIFMFSC
jgi:hypothetical protein